jgi:hypothetical protein
MVEIIAIIIFIGSLCGIGIILFRKIPALKELPIEKENAREEYFSDVGEEAKQTNLYGFVCFENFLKKFLMRIRIFSLKIENAVNGLLKKIREKQERKNEFLDNGEEEDNQENNGKDDIEDVKEELENKLETQSEIEPKPKPKPKPEIKKDNYWEELKKFKKEKITRRKVARKKKKD